MADTLQTLFAARLSPLADHAVAAPGDVLSAPQPTAILLYMDAVDAQPPAATRSAVVLDAGAGQWLIVSEQDTAADLRARYAGHVDRAMLTDISHARCRIRVQGPNARDILQSGMALDLYPPALTTGASTPTAFRDIAIHLHARGEAMFDLYVLRSYAQSLWTWLREIAGKTSQ